MGEKATLEYPLMPVQIEVFQSGKFDEIHTIYTECQFEEFLDYDKSTWLDKRRASDANKVIRHLAEVVNYFQDMNTYCAGMSSAPVEYRIHAI